MNTYLLTFGGFLLLGGRLGDLFGHRRLFVAGITLFTAASLACGLATSQEMPSWRAPCRASAAPSSPAVALSLIVTLFTEPSERAKAMGVAGFVASTGGSIGVLLGGILTDTLNWHWIPRQCPDRDRGPRPPASCCLGAAFLPAASTSPARSPSPPR